VNVDKIKSTKQHTQTLQQVLQVIKADLKAPKHPVQQDVGFKAMCVIG